MPLDIETYWTSPPPEPSPKLQLWLERIDAGWKPNRRITRLGYYNSCLFFDVYLWEYIHVLAPKLYPSAWKETD